MHIPVPPPSSLWIANHGGALVTGANGAPWSGNLGGFVLAVALVAGLVWRLPLGIDLSDEAYYAIFIDDWLKGGIASSALITLHQTAALLVYMPIRLSAAIRGSAEGRLLQLRGLFLTGQLIAASFWLLLLLRLRTPFVAWLGACFVLANIPFGLPAPSYNTLGQQGLTVALATLALALLNRDRFGLWAILSSLAWTIALVAYPSMVVPLATCLLVLLSTGPRDRFWWTYLLAIVVFQVAAWTLVASALSLDRLLASARYLSAINDVGNLPRKIDFSLGLLQHNPTFTAACVLAVVVGVIRNRIGSTVTAVAIAALVGVLLTRPPCLFGRSHDALTIIALTGFGLVPALWRKMAAPQEQIIALVWAISFVAGLTTMATATNSLFNFCVGAAPAAAVSLAALRPTGRVSFGSTIIAYGAGLTGILATSLFFYYGNPPDRPRPDTVVADGAYAGLRGQPDQVAVIDWMAKQVSPLAEPDKTIAFFGRIFGLILATTARPLMPGVYPLSGTIKPEGLETTRAFFDPAEHRPKLVVIFRDVYIDPVVPFATKLDQWYQRVGVKDGPIGRFELYRRR